MNKKGFSLVCATVLGMASTACFGFSVFSPMIEEGETGVELRYARVMAGEALEKGSQNLEAALEWHFSENWRMEFTLENEQPKGMSMETEMVELEFIRGLTEQEGSEGFSSAVVLGYGLAQEDLAADTVSLGMYLMRGYGVAGNGQEKEENESSYASSVLVNAVYERQVGSNSTGETEFSYGIQYKHALDGFSAGLELFGEMNDVAKEHYAGPVLFGELPLGEAGVAYQLGYMVGLSEAAVDGVLKLNLGMEF
ncbi:MAG: hypothetical protein OEZ68_14475 [Gammaproteobacteria bacterium]|nr:hypothetical protein [Gammaproteobacteria bacterium]MDH5802008.1 hypothetical protein [Gammaproteobacteria bacterium]